MNEHQAAASPDDVALNPRIRAQSTELLHALLQATDYGILLCSLDRQDIIANRRLGELFCMTPQDIVETDPDSVRRRVLTRVRDPQAFVAGLDRAFSDPALTMTDELELIGEPARALRRSTGPVLGAQGEPIARLWTFLDITETKRLQAEVQAQLLARTQEFAATEAVLHAMNALCGLAAEPRETPALIESILKIVHPVCDCSGSALALLDAEAQSLAGAFLVAGQSVEPLSLALKRDRALSSLLDTGRKAVREERGFQVYAGPLARRLRTRSLDVAALRNDDRVIGVFLMGASQEEAADTGERRYRSVHLRALMDQVALTLETHRLQSDLRAALEAVKAAQQNLVEMEKLRASGALAASVAHDIRNILAAMQIEMAAHPQEIPDAFCAHLNRFSALTHRLLAFFRPSVLETRPTSLGDVVEHVLPLVEGQAGINHVAIRQELPADLPPVAADSSQLEHLFVNLCLNAIQAMTERGGSLSLTGVVRGEWIAIEVADTGPGIPPAILDRIFDPFFTTRATGFGLGLFSCKRIVEEHGGQLSVRNESGRGACFTVLLPAMPGPAN